MWLEYIKHNAQLLGDNSCPGIYYLLKDGVIVYIGQSKNMRKRIGSHLAQGEKDFDSYHTQKCPEEKLHHYETKAILRFRPAYNKTLPNNSIYANIHTLRVDCQMTVGELSMIIKRHNIKAEWICNQDVYKREEIREVTS